MKAIETSYGGCRFRSRLEARWAVFFDTLGISWQYELQGYDLDGLMAAIYRGVLVAKENGGDRGDPWEHHWPWEKEDPSGTCGGAWSKDEWDPIPAPRRLGAYLPDFWLPKQQMWFEVKGVEPEGRDWDRLLAFDTALSWNAVSGRLITYVGEVPNPDRVDSGGPPYDDDYELSGMVMGDHHHCWTRCAWCGIYDVQFDARSARTYCGCHHERGCHPTMGRCNGDKCYAGDHPTLLQAYHNARSARFEHGETGGRMR